MGDLIDRIIELCDGDKDKFQKVCGPLVSKVMAYEIAYGIPCSDEYLKEHFEAILEEVTTQNDKFKNNAAYKRAMRGL